MDHEKLNRALQLIANSRNPTSARHPCFHQPASLLEQIAASIWLGTRTYWIYEIRSVEERPIAQPAHSIGHRALFIQGARSDVSSAPASLLLFPALVSCTDQTVGVTPGG